VDTSTDHAEERRWRRWPPYEEADDEPPLPAQQIAAIYRSLRKGREDSKDEPGAADFYYGEMEMRRKRDPKTVEGGWVRQTPAAERVILWLYWAVAGYGLRASRALGWLVATVLGFAVLLWLWGLEDPRSFWDALLFSLQSTTSLLGGEDRALTDLGEALWTALRLLGPLLFGLMLLSLRGRVKR
jgi:hypothetical protein